MAFAVGAGRAVLSRCAVRRTRYFVVPATYTHSGHDQPGDQENDAGDNEQDEPTTSRSG
ncbi:hypothetical protein [Hymenobacter gummosus]|uniref:hypothetical protein n=1 Tax=Hymenobacter gummosus TaxID=1776032 RepID=UPI001FB5028F|nr:hypothetical protein [Hymenobacter gummosus]